MLETKNKEVREYVSTLSTDKVETNNKRSFISK